MQDSHKDVVKIHFFNIKAYFGWRLKSARNFLAPVAAYCFHLSVMESVRLIPLSVLRPTNI